ncbi:MAG: hypothetical protein R3F37_23680 [Candidatus Competibacteraceae bacterium]
MTITQMAAQELVRSRRQYKPPADLLDGERPFSSPAISKEQSAVG